MATTEWISKAAQQYRQDLSEKRREENGRRRIAELEQARLDRIASEGPAVGAQLWANLQQVIKNDVAEFNREFDDTVLWTEARGDGSFNVRFEWPGGAQKIATLTYDVDTLTMSWLIHGSTKGIPLTIGIRKNGDSMQPNVNPIEFMNGDISCEIDRISQNILTALLP